MPSGSSGPSCRTDAAPRQTRHARAAGRHRDPAGRPAAGLAEPCLRGGSVLPFAAGLSCRTPWPAACILPWVRCAPANAGAGGAERLGRKAVWNAGGDVAGDGCACLGPERLGARRGPGSRHFWRRSARDWTSAYGLVHMGREVYSAKTGRTCSAPCGRCPPAQVEGQVRLALLERKTTAKEQESAGAPDPAPAREEAASRGARAGGMQTT